MSEAQEKCESRREHDNTVPAIVRAVRILEFLEASDKSVGLAQISSQLALPKTTVFRILRTLKQLGFVKQDAASGNFWLGPRLLSMANSIRSRLSVVKLSIPFMEDLTATTGETCKLSICGDREVVVLHAVESRKEMSVRTDLAGRFHLHAGAASKLLAAYLPEEEAEKIIESGLTRDTSKTITDPEQLRQELERIRRQGFSEDNEEFIEGIRALACPVYDDQGHVIAALSVPYVAVNHSEDRRRFLLQSLSTCALGISGSLGHRARG